MTRNQIIEVIRIIGQDIAKRDGQTNDFRYGAACALNCLEDEIIRFFKANS